MDRRDDVNPWRVRLVWIGVTLLALIGIAAAARRALILAFGIGASPVTQALDAGFARHPLLTFVHIIPGVLFMVLGPFQFMPAIRTRRLWQHRWSGRAFVAAGYVVGVSALAMSWQMSIGGANETAATTLFATRQLPGEADLLRLHSRVPKGRDDDEPVAVPLRGLAEFHVERFSGRGDRLAVGENHLPGERPGGACDDGDPIAIAKLDRVPGEHVHVREDPQHLLHRRGVGDASVNRLCVAGDVRDHVWVVDRVDRCEIASVERVVPLLHEREQVCGAGGIVGHGRHEASFCFMRDDGGSRRSRRRERSWNTPCPSP